MLLAIGLFGLASLRPSLAADLGSQRRGALIAATEGATVGGVNVPLALLTLYLVWSLVQMAWRWSDVDAVVATEHGMLFHPTTRLRRVAWADVETVALATLLRAPSLMIHLRNGRTRSVRGIDAEHEGAAAFVAFAQSRIDRAIADRAKP